MYIRSLKLYILYRNHKSGKCIHRQRDRQTDISMYMYVHIIMRICQTQVYGVKYYLLCTCAYVHMYIRTYMHICPHATYKNGTFSDDTETVLGSIFSDICMN